MAAKLTCPLTLPPATAFAVAAKLTCPVTLPPVIDVSADPLPLTLVNTPFVAPMFPTLALPDTLRLPNVPSAVTCV